LDMPMIYSYHTQYAILKKKREQNELNDIY